MSRCCICGSPDVRIHITGDGEYCLACNNARMLERMGKADDYHYQEKIYVMDDEQELHLFHLEHSILGALVHWEAKEEGSCKTISLITDVDEPASRGIKIFYQKIVASVSSRTIEKKTYNHPISNLLLRNGKYYSLKSKGNLHIVNEGDGICFEIDGEIFTPEETAKMLGSHENFRIQYQIFDASDDILRKNEVLVAEQVGEEVQHFKLN